MTFEEMIRAELTKGTDINKLIKDTQLKMENERKQQEEERKKEEKRKQAALKLQQEKETNLRITAIANNAICGKLTLSDLTFLCNTFATQEKLSTTIAEDELRFLFYPEEIDEAIYNAITNTLHALLTPNPSKKDYKTANEIIDDFINRLN